MPVYTVNQLMKTKDWQVPKFASKKFQNGWMCRAADLKAFLKEKAHIVFGGNNG